MLAVIYQFVENIFLYLFGFLGPEAEVTRNENAGVDNQHAPPPPDVPNPDTNSIFGIIILYISTAFLFLYAVLVGIFVFINNHRRICGMIFIFIFILVPASITTVYVVVNRHHPPKFVPPKFQFFNTTTHKFEIQDAQLSYDATFYVLVWNSDKSNQLDIISNVSLSVSNVSVGVSNIPTLHLNAGQSMLLNIHLSKEKINFELKNYVFDNIIYYFLIIKSDVTVHSVKRQQKIYSYQTETSCTIKATQPPGGYMKESSCPIL